MSPAVVSVRAIQESDLQSVRAFLQQEAGATSFVSRGRLHEANRLPGFAAFFDDNLVGVLNYRVDGYEMEIVTIYASVHRRGVGTALMNAAREAAHRIGARRIWLITTNDNLPAISFYKRQAFRLVAVHKGAVEESRKLKPEIPLYGIAGAPITDELEFEAVP